MSGTDKLDQKAPARILERDQMPRLGLVPLYVDEYEARRMLIRLSRAACLGAGFYYVDNGCVGD